MFVMQKSANDSPLIQDVHSGSSSHSIQAAITPSILMQTLDKENANLSEKYYEYGIFKYCSPVTLLEIAHRCLGVYYKSFKCIIYCINVSSNIAHKVIMLFMFDLINIIIEENQ